MTQEELKLYAVRNQEGKWFHAVGYGGGGGSWVDDFTKAKIYTKISVARSRVSFFATRWPEYGVPDLIELVVGECRVIKEEERVAKVIKDKKTFEENRNVREMKRKLKQAKLDVERAQKEFDKLKGTT